MTGVVLDDFGRARVFDRVTGEVLTWPAPTAIENVKLGGGRYVHGETGERMKAPPAEVVAEEPPVPLRQEETLDLPADEAAAREEALAVVFAPEAAAPLLQIEAGASITGPLVVEAPKGETFHIDPAVHAFVRDEDKDGHDDATGKFVAPQPPRPAKRRGGAKK